MSDSRPPDLRETLVELARNLAFSWLPVTRELFARLGGERWEALAHNPVALLAELGDVEPTAELVELAARAREELAAELSARSWWEEEHGRESDFLVAYFSAEFGVDESLPIYSGGLGVLAGDHLKSASELGLPLVGVGLFYLHGYFRQGLDAAGDQTERYPEADPDRLPVTLARGENGDPIEVTVELGRERLGLEEIRARVWRADVGRVRLYLLDCDVDGNPGWARDITDALYGGDREHRIHQEVLLGVGGVRALRALGIAPTVFHMNEGHSAFLQLERLRELAAAGVDREQALELLRASSVFTTHTPVPAGNEVFILPLVRRQVAKLVEECGLTWREFRALGMASGERLFGMTPFALRTSAYANGVAALHGEVSRAMWWRLWPDRGVEAVPIGSVTNGVHARTWVDPRLVERIADADRRPAFERAVDLADDDLWQLHADGKRRLAARSPGLDPEALTIGFARRFATYKRAWLLFSQPDRLARLLFDPDRPVQIVVAGKSHPQDEGGKALIREIVGFARDPRSAGHVVFLEDYDIGLARVLVQGVDVWLNNPRRPHEASGTSGMKAAMNGVLNCSILDGWWPEGYTPETGFVIGGETVDPDEAVQDAADAEALYRVLEQSVVPLFYERDGGQIPRRWLAMMKQSIARLGAQFNTNRMVEEYVERFYLPAHRDGAARRHAHVAS
jgi:starch phosphorylase